MDAQEEDRRVGDERRGFHLSRDISIADILGIVVIGIPALIWAGKMDTRVQQVETAMVEVRRESLTTDISQDKQREELRREFKEDLREISRKLDSLIEKVGNGGVRR